jgi:hypothetical protein
MKVEDWTMLLTDAKYVHGIYSQPPDLSKVSIIEVVLDREASMLKLRFDVFDYPDRPPEKWVSDQFNRAQFTLHVVEVTIVQILGWSHEVIGALSISKVETGVQVLFSNGKEKIECLGAFLVLDKIAGYSG